MNNCITPASYYFTSRATLAAVVDRQAEIQSQQVATPYSIQLKNKLVTVKSGLLKNYAGIFVRYHCGGSMELYACILLLAYMVYL
jgi:hypothetical protein